MAPPEVSSLSAITITPVDIAIPEIAPSIVPEIPSMPVPELPPEPNPNEEPTPETLPEPEPGPTPDPVPSPMPAPAPAPTPPPPATPSHPSALIPQTASVTSAAPRPAPATAQPAAAAGPQVDVNRVLTAQEMSEGKAAANGFLIGGYVFCLLALMSLFGIQASSGLSAGGVIWLLLLVVVAVVLFRQGARRGVIGEMKVVVNEPVALGDALRLRIALPVFRLVTGAQVEVTVVAEETADRGQGNNGRMRETVFSRTLPVQGCRTLPAGHEAAISVAVPLPPGALPSFQTSLHSGEWKVVVRVSLPGSLPTISKTVPLMVPPVRVGQTPLALSERTFNLPALTDLHGQFTLKCALGANNTPTVELTAPIPFTLTLAPQRDATAQSRVTVELGYFINGPARNERFTVQRQTLFTQAWKGGQALEATQSFVLPRTVPITYAGRIVHVSWWLAITAIQPFGATLRQEIPVVVLPMSAGE